MSNLKDLGRPLEKKGDSPAADGILAFFCDPLWGYREINAFYANFLMNLASILFLLHILLQEN